MNDEALMTKDERMTKPKRTRDDFEDAFWNHDLESFVREEPNEKCAYNLEERTARFGEAIIDFAKTIPQSAVTNRIIGQLVGAGTSVGANYVEADDAVSKKEFLKNIGTCKKEAREVKHFLRMAVRTSPDLETRSSQALDGSQGTASDFRQDLEKRKKWTTKWQRGLGTK
jgi:four helix bundle protein